MKVNPLKDKNQGPVLTYLLLSILVFSLFTLLTACGERAASTGGNSEPAGQAKSNAAVKSPTGPVTPQVEDKQPGVKTDLNSVESKSQATKEKNNIAPLAKSPVIRLSSQTVQIGSQLEVSGTAFPANTRL